jgi:hypothetical protein
VSTTLRTALASIGVPDANFEFIERLTDGVDAVNYRVVNNPGKPYVIAERRAPGPNLHIYYGGTNGFTSEAEVVRILGEGANRRVSGSRRGTWCAVHPVNYARDPGKPPQRHREPDFCSCGMQRSLTGVCDICD